MRFGLALLVMITSLGACTSKEFNEEQVLFAPIMIAPQMKAFSACVEVYDLKAARERIQKARADKAVIEETSSFIATELPGYGPERFFLKLKDCQRFTEDLEYQGWKKH